MVWCPTCGEDVEADYNESGAMTACVNCGRVLEDAAFASDVTFMKGADGEGEMVGQFVGDDGTVRGLQRMAGGKVWSSRGDSHEVSLSKGRTELSSMIDHFVIRPAQDCLEAAHRLYRLAVEEGFTRGRVVAQVAACCLYIICRQESKPFMLIDLSDLLQVNVYKLGSVYLQLTKLLRLEDHPCLTRPIDPCLYIHRFAEKLLADSQQREVTEVINTAMRLIGQMKRDWMQTGRRPAGVCGAALWMSCHIHGHHKTKADVMGVVHVGWSTLDRRVREFAASGASALTPKEFEAVAAAAEEQTAALLARVQSPQYLEAQQRLALPAPPADKDAGAGDTPAHDPAAAAAGADGAAGSSRVLVVAPERPSVVCEHISEGAARHAAMGLCLDCFKHFLVTSGGIWGTAEDPPAFQKAQRKAAEAAEVAAAAAAAGEEQEEEEEDGWVEREVGGLLVRMPAGHGSEEEIRAEMEAEQARQQQRQQQQGGAAATAAAAAAAGGQPEQQGASQGEEQQQQQQPDAAAAVGQRRGRGRPPLANGRGRGRQRVSLTWRGNKGRTAASTATRAVSGSSNGGNGGAVSSPFDAFDAAAAAAEAAMAAAAGGRGSRGRGVGRTPPARGRGRGRGAAAAAAGGGSGGGVDAAELAADVAELDAALDQLHDAVLHPEQQQQQAAAAAAAAPVPAAAAAAAPVSEGGSEQFGSALLGYGTACLKRPASASQQQQQQQQAGEDGPAAKRPRPASSSQQPTQCPGTPSQRSSRQQPHQQQGQQPGDADVAAALAASAVEGLGLPPGAAAGLQQVMGLTPETGALVPVPVEGQEQGASGSNAAAAAAAAAGDGDSSGEESDGNGGSSSSSSSSDGSDLGEIESDEIEAYIRPRSAVKIQEMIWNGLHKDWIAGQEAKRAAAEAAAAADTTAAAVAAENRAAFEAREARDGVEGDEGAAAAAADEASGRRQRAKPGPKKGSHNKKVAPLPEADNPAAAARLNVEAHRHLSEKINYRVLDDLFEDLDTAGAFAAGGGTGGGGGDSRAVSGDGGAAAAGGGAELEVEAGPSSFRAARARQAEQRAAAETAAAARASQQLQEEARRRGAGGGLGGLGLPPAAAAAGGGSEGGAGGAGTKPGKGRLGSLSRPGSTRLGSLRR